MLLWLTCAFVGFFVCFLFSYHLGIIRTTCETTNPRRNNVSVMETQFLLHPDQRHFSFIYAAKGMQDATSETNDGIYLTRCRNVHVKNHPGSLYSQWKPSLNTLIESQRQFLSSWFMSKIGPMKSCHEKDHLFLAKKALLTIWYRNIYIVKLGEKNLTQSGWDNLLMNFFWYMKEVNYDFT